MLVDMHCHLDFKQFDQDLDKVIERAKNAGVVNIINNGIDHSSNLKTLSLAKGFDIIKPALGVYPEFAINMDENTIDEEIDFIKKSQPVAIGEVGLDNYRVPELKKQKIAFEKFIQLSEGLNIPIIVHCRKAEQEVFDMLNSSNNKKVIFHCYTGPLNLAKRIEENGWYFSIPPSILRDTSFQVLVKEISNTHLLTETDAPFLAPVKGKRNEPAYVKETVKKIAEIKGTAIEETENIIFMNYKRLFG